MGPKSRKTRRQSGDFGAPAELPDAGALPTNTDVIAAVKYEVTKSEATTNEDKEIDAVLKRSLSVGTNYRRKICLYQNQAFI